MSRKEQIITTFVAASVSILTLVAVFMTAHYYIIHQ